MTVTPTQLAHDLALLRDLLCRYGGPAWLANNGGRTALDLGLGLLLALEGERQRVEEAEWQERVTRADEVVEARAA